jgi:hypothetical protein
MIFGLEKGVCCEKRGGSLYSVYILIRPTATILHTANSLSPPEIFLFYPGTWGNCFTNSPCGIRLTYHDLLFHEMPEITANSIKRCIIPFFITKFERKIKNQRSTWSPGPNQTDIMLCLNASTVTFPKVGFYDKVSIRIKIRSAEMGSYSYRFFCMVIFAWLCRIFFLYSKHWKFQNCFKICNSKGDLYILLHYGSLLSIE